MRLGSFLLLTYLALSHTLDVVSSCKTGLFCSMHSMFCRVNGTSVPNARQTVEQRAPTHFSRCCFFVQ